LISEFPEISVFKIEDFDFGFSTLDFEDFGKVCDFFGSKISEISKFSKSSILNFQISLKKLIPKNFDFQIFKIFDFEFSDFCGEFCEI
jgi:hypothetical protein